MPVYNAPLLQIDPKETRRYAGLMRAKDFDERLIEEACQDARLLAEPRGIWQLYDYDCENQIVKAEPPFHIEGKKIGKHLAGCDKVILLAVTVGDGIEERVTKRFADGEYASSVLLDAAATTAVEQLADGMEKPSSRKWPHKATACAGVSVPAMATGRSNSSPSSSARQNVRPSASRCLNQKCSCRARVSRPSSAYIRKSRAQKAFSTPPAAVRPAIKSTAPHASL